MQTFLPYSSFTESAQCLDYRRLGKQRIEAKQIHQTLLGESDGWKNHPAVKMWQGFEGALAIYGLTMCLEWSVIRGFNDTTLPYFLYYAKSIIAPTFPTWLGLEEFHSSHRSNLIRKFPEHYNQFNWKELDNLPYYWPK